MNIRHKSHQTLSALLDNALPDEVAAKVQEHLAQCDDCQKEWTALQDLDRQLASALRLDLIDEPVSRIQELSAGELDRVSDSDSFSQPSVGKLVALFLAIAASIALMTVFLPDKEKPTGAPIIAQLVRATGPIRIKQPKSDQWSVIQPEESVEVLAGAIVRTDASVLCEIQTDGEGKLRLNESSDLCLKKSDQIELLKGQLWCLSPKESGIEINISVQDDTPASEPTVVTLRCPTSSELQCTAEPQKAIWSSVSKTNLPTSCNSAGLRCTVEPGETVAVDADQSVDRSMNMEARSKIWQLPLLAIGSNSSLELFACVESVLAPIGRTKAMHLNERQIRRLGPSGAIPLLAFVIEEESSDARRVAMRIAGDLADDSAIKYLNRLSNDADPFVATTANSALNRIAKQVR